MRYLLIMLMSLMLAAPAYAAGTADGTADAPAAPQAARKAKGVTKVAPVDTVAKALTSANKTPVAVTGTIVTFIWSLFRDGYASYHIGLLVALFLTRFVSLLFFGGVLVVAIQKLIEKAGVLRRD